MRRIDRQVIREAPEPLIGRPVEIVGKRFGLFWPDQVGAGGAAGKDGSSTEERQRLEAVKQQIGKVLRRMPGGAKGSKGQSAKIDFFTVF